MKLSSKYKEYIDRIVENSIEERSKLAALVSSLLEENDSLHKKISEQRFEIQLLERKLKK